MRAGTDPYDLLIRKLGARETMDGDDIAKLRAAIATPRNIEPGAYLVREGNRPTTCGFVVSGFAFRQKLTTDGGRQIVGFVTPGDFFDLQNLMLGEADHNVQALNRLEILEGPIAALRRIVVERPAIARALWADTLVEASLFRETILNIGRRSAAARVAHQICELEVRLATVGLANGGYDLPLTQEQFADALGLTAVHVNRTLKLLEKEGLIARSKRRVRIVDWPRLVERADFNERYLHLRRD